MYVTVVCENKSGFYRYLPRQKASFWRQFNCWLPNPVDICHKTRTWETFSSLLRLFYPPFFASSNFAACCVPTGPMVIRIYEKICIRLAYIKCLFDSFNLRSKYHSLNFVINHIEEVDYIYIYSMMRRFMIKMLKSHYWLRLRALRSPLTI